MIDYDKLELVHTLCLRTDCGFTHRVIRARWDGKDKIHQVFELMHPSKGFNFYESLEDVITELRRQNELSFRYSNKQSLLKYRIGQIVWRLGDDYRPLQGVIADIDYDSEEKYLVDYNLDDDEWCIEEELYANKKDLVKAHLNYWISMVEETER